MSAHRWFLVSVCLITLFRVWANISSGLPLFFDEAQYWDWAQDLQFGYYSKPPMVAWLIALTTYFFGNAEWAVRLSSSFLHAGTSLLIYSLARALFPQDARVASWSGVLYLTLPGVALSSHLVSTDPALLFFWALSLLFGWYALRTDRWCWWLGLGGAVGLGMLSKYSMLMIAPAFGLLFLMVPEYRRYLVSVRMWSAVVLAGLVFLPNVIWNWEHGFVSVGHTRDNLTANASGFSLQWAAMLEFLLAQLAVVGPFLAVGMVWALMRCVRDVVRLPGRDIPASALFLSISVVPFLIVVLGVSLFSRAHANWAVPIYVSGVMGVVAFSLHRSFLRWILPVSLILNLCVLVLVGVWNPLMERGSWARSAKHFSLAHAIVWDPFARLRGAPELAGALLPILRAHPDAALLVDSRKLYALLRYYLPRDVLIYKVSGSKAPRDHYDLTRKFSEDVAHDSYVFIGQYDEKPVVATRFTQAVLLQTLEISTHVDRVQRHPVYLLQDYRYE